MSELPRRLPVYKVREVIVRRSGVSGRGGRRLSPFVGRARELASLQVLLNQVEAGQGQVVGIVGEPGIGKSRLLYEFSRTLHGRQVEYLEEHCLAYAGSSPPLGAGSHVYLSRIIDVMEPQERGSGCLQGAHAPGRW
jgi:AAA ATPase domain